MANPKDLIRAGLDAHERAKNGPTTPKLAALAGITGDIHSLSEIVTNVKKARTRLVALKKAEVEEADAMAVAIKAVWKDRGVSIDERGIRSDNFTGTQRRKFIEDDIKQARKERQAITVEERAKHVVTLREAKTNLDLVRELWPSHVAVLMRQTLGSEKRATYTQNLAAAGPTEIDSAARTAAGTGDKNLAAACCVRIDAMGKEPRKLLTYTKSDIAEEMVAKEFNAATEFIGLADFYRASGDLMARELEGRKVSPDDKIRVGQNLRELALKIGKTLDADGNHTEEDGSPKNETFEARLDRLYPGGPLPAGYEIVDVGDSNNE